MDGERGRGRREREERTEERGVRGEKEKADIEWERESQIENREREVE